MTYRILEQAPDGVQLRDVAGGRHRTSLTHATATSVEEVAFSPDGKTLAAGSYREVRLWNMAGRKQRARLENPANTDAMALSRDGRFLAAACGDQKVRLWKIPK